MEFWLRYIADSEYFGGGDFTLPGCLNFQELHRDSVTSHAICLCYTCEWWVLF